MTVWANIVHSRRQPTPCHALPFIAVWLARAYFTLPGGNASYATLGCLLLLGLPSRFYLTLPVAMHHICSAPTLLTIYQRICCHFPRALHPLPRAACH